MYDENSVYVEDDPWAPRCSITTFLHRIAFTVMHASFFLERKNTPKKVRIPVLCWQPYVEGFFWFFQVLFNLELNAKNYF